MSVKLQPTSAIKVQLGINPNGRIQKFFTNECARHMDKYVPFDTGTLAETVIQNGFPTANVTDTSISYEQEYAQVVYYGMRNGKEITIHTDKHYFATTYWDQAMWSAEGQDIVKSVQKEIERGGKK